MKHLSLIIISFFICHLVGAQDKKEVINELKVDINPLDTLQFDAIIAYTINFDSIKKRRNRSQILYEASQYDLSPKQTSYRKNVDKSLFADVVTILSDTSTYGVNYADCFEPRFVLQFKFQNIENFRIVICEGCGHLVSTLPLPAAYVKYYDIDIEEGGQQKLYRRYLKGFSTIGKSKINNLCKLLKMGYCEILE